MDNSIHHHLTQNSQWDAPDVLAPQFGKVRTTHGVLFEKFHNPFNSHRQVFMDIDMIEDICLVLTDEPSALYSCIRKDHITAHLQRPNWIFSGIILR